MKKSYLILIAIIYIKKFSMQCFKEKHLSVLSIALRTIFMSLVHHCKWDFPQAKFNYEIYARFLLNKHRKVPFLFQVWNVATFRKKKNALKLNKGYHCTDFWRTFDKRTPYTSHVPFWITVFIRNNHKNLKKSNIKCYF